MELICEQRIEGLCGSYECDYVKMNDKNKDKYEEGVRVAVLGPTGTFTEAAAKSVFGNIKFMYCETVDDVFSAVDSGMDFGVAAIENSLEGSITTTMDCLLEYIEDHIKIYQEIILDINLCLMAPKDTKVEEIRTVISHPHALAQCKKFLRKKFPEAKQRRVESTTSAMIEVADTKNSAAIGPMESGGIYGLEVIREHVEDYPSQTRFIVISKKESPEEVPKNKITIIFALKDDAGALYNVLKIFAKRKINLTKIESRPSKRKLGGYFFFMEFCGSLKDGNITGAISDAKKRTNFLGILGNY